MRSNNSKSQPPDNKYRTREHIIADLSVNYVERIVLQSGHRMDRVSIGADYGYDGQVYTCNNSIIENGSILLQLKATNHLRLVNGGKAISYVARKADASLWNSEGMPVFLIVYDAQKECAYWRYMQPFLKNSARFPLKSGKTSLTIHIPVHNILDEAAINEFRRIKNEIMMQISQKVDYDV